MTTTRWRKVLLGLTVTGAAVTGACGSGDSSEPSGSAPTSAPSQTPGSQPSNVKASDVVIAEFAYSPKEIQVEQGGAVRWTNRDAFEHTVTSGAVDGPENVPDGLFDESMADAGTAATVTFDEAGRFTYYCKQHNAMDGVVVVTPPNQDDQEK